MNFRFEPQPLPFSTMTLIRVIVLFLFRSVVQFGLHNAKLCFITMPLAQHDFYLCSHPLHIFIDFYVLPLLYQHFSTRFFFSIRAHCGILYNCQNT